MTTIDYTQTPYYGLDKYGDKSPADLRDGHNHNMDIIDRSLKDNSEAIKGKADKAEVYNKAEVDGKVKVLDDEIALKADKADTYTKSDVDGKVTTLNHEIATKADKISTYTKTEVDDKLAPVNTKLSNHDTALTSLKGTIESLPDRSGRYTNEPQLFAHFLSSDEAMYFAWSPDGLSWEDVGVRWKPSTGTVRDPSIICTSSAIQAVFTYHKNRAAKAPSIGVARFDRNFNIKLFNEYTPRNVNTDEIWAPEFFVDPDSGQTYILASISEGGNNFVAYWALFDSPDVWHPFHDENGHAIGGIDWSMYRSAGRYWLLGAGHGDIDVYVGDSPRGPFKKDHSVFGYDRQFEGFSAFRLANGQWRVIMDKGGFVSPQSDDYLFYKDLDERFNVVPQNPDLTAFPVRGRHGSVTTMSGNATTARYAARDASTIVLLQDRVIDSLHTDWPNAKICTFQALQNGSNYGSSVLPDNTPAQMKIYQDGIYLLSCSVVLKGLTGNPKVILQPSVNGQGDTPAGVVMSSLGAAGQVSGTVTVPLELSVGDSVDVRMILSADSPVGVHGQCYMTNPSYLSMVRL